MATRSRPRARSSTPKSGGDSLIYLVVLLALIIYGGGTVVGTPEGEADAPTPVLVEEVSHEQVATALNQLGSTPLVPARGSVPGFHRDNFGRGWVDVDRNGCDTRNDVLARDLNPARLRADSTCVVESGVLHDPFTGAILEFVRGSSNNVDIDHLYPLSRAWDMGAADWPEQRRIEFSNDQDLNLWAVSASANRAKGDRGPGEWLPPNVGARCAYAVAYTGVAHAYGLGLTTEDHAVLNEILDDC